MTAIDVEKLLKPVSAEAPSGENLEYDNAFQELDRAAAPSTGTSMVGDAEGESPKWPEIARMAEELLDRTKDLRIAMHLARARLNTHGAGGLADGMSLIKGLLTNFWDDVHPQLDAEDDNDPTQRINSLDALNKPNGFAKDLGQVPIVNARQAGRYSLRDVRIAAGEVPVPEGVEAPDPNIIDAAFLECDLDELKQSAAAVARVRDELPLIESFITEKVGPTNNTLSVKPLTDELAEIARIYSVQLVARGVDVEPAAGEEEAAVVARRVTGDIRSREDAVHMLDKISEYFRRNEPSSPVPLLLQRAKGLVAKDFMEILRDLTPDAVQQAEMYGQSRDKG